jgi:hypothetical protein
VGEVVSPPSHGYSVSYATIHSLSELLGDPKLQVSNGHGFGVSWLFGRVPGQNIRFLITGRTLVSLYLF